MLLLIALILSICTFAQNVAVTKQLKAKYSIVESAYKKCLREE